MKKVRESLHYYTYYEHAVSQFIVANDLKKSFESWAFTSPPYKDIRLKENGYFWSMSLLTALTIENLFKSLFLFKQFNRIESGDISKFEEIIKKWGGNAHDIVAITDKYKIELNFKQRELIKDLMPFFMWAGRFPFPKNENEIELYEKGNRQLSFRPDYLITTKELFKYFEKEMNLTSTNNLKKL